MGGGGRSRVVAVVQARRVVAGQGSGSRGRVGLVQLLPDAVGRGGRPLGCLPLEGREHGRGQVQLLSPTRLHGTGQRHTHTQGEAQITLQLQIPQTNTRLDCLCGCSSSSALTHYCSIYWDGSVHPCDWVGGGE